jgi:hypothetical protein
MWAWMTVLVFIASMVLAGRMAHARHRSIRAWVWVAAIAGPLGPLVLYLLGDCPDETSYA